MMKCTECSLMSELLTYYCEYILCTDFIETTHVALQTKRKALYVENKPSLIYLSLCYTFGHAHLKGNVQI